METGKLKIKTTSKGKKFSQGIQTMLAEYKGQTIRITFEQSVYMTSKDTFKVCASPIVIQEVIPEPPKEEDQLEMFK